jgi:mannose/fructose/N-acetylgalactosamine-specific phosphotransferase system component IID
MAGIGDSMIPGTLIPILLSIGIGISQADGNVIGPIFYIVAYTAIILGLSYYLFMFGYRYGMSAMRQLAEGSFQRITHSMAVMGLVVAGAIGAGLISLTTPLQVTSGDTVLLSVQDKLNGIFPQLLPLLLVLWLWNGMRRRGWPINRALGMTFLVVFIGFLPGLLGALFNLPWLASLRIF